EIDGDLLAGINVNLTGGSTQGDGAIGKIVVEGTVGVAANDRVLIRAPRGIEVFHGEGNVFADVDAVIATYSPATIGVVRAEGNFTGVIEAEAFADTSLDPFTGLDVRGDLVSAS